MTPAPDPSLGEIVVGFIVVLALFAFYGGLKAQDDARRTARRRPRRRSRFG